MCALGIKINYFFLKKLIDHPSENAYLDKTLIYCFVLLFIELLRVLGLCKFVSAKLSQDDIFRIASVGFKMGDYSHSDALILEVYHILCTGSKVNIPCAQL